MITPVRLAGFPRSGGAGRADYEFADCVGRFALARRGDHLARGPVGGQDYNHALGTPAVLPVPRVRLPRRAVEWFVWMGSGVPRIRKKLLANQLPRKAARASAGGKYPSPARMRHMPLCRDGGTDLGA